MVALFARHTTGAGQIVDSAIYRGRPGGDGVPPAGLGGRRDPRRRPVPCSGHRTEQHLPERGRRRRAHRGRTSDTVFERLCEPWASPSSPPTPVRRPRRPGEQARTEFDTIIADWAAQRQPADISPPLSRRRRTGGLTYTVADVLADPQLQSPPGRIARSPGTNASSSEYAKGPGVVPELSDTPGPSCAGRGRPGQHNDEVYGRATRHRARRDRLAPRRRVVL